MLINTLTDTIKEAERFIKKAESLRDEIMDAREERKINDEYIPDCCEGYFLNNLNAGVKRSSLDLTRRLVDLRQNR